MLLGVAILLIIYTSFIAYSVYGWLMAKESPIDEERVTLTEGLDVIIPYRNEKNALELLISDLSSLSEMSKEVRFIFVNDNSDDDSEIVIEAAAQVLPILSLKSQGQGKKAALIQGLQAAETNHVLFWDADIRVHPSYFSGLHSYRSLDFMILPVLPIYNKGFWSRYASLDFIALIGMTFSWARLGRPIMANGANLLVKKCMVNFAHDSASGDDVQSLHAIKKVGGNIGSTLDRRVQVHTQMPDSFSEFFQQRLRWAAKSVSYSDRDTRIVGWSHVLFYTAFLGLAIVLLMHGRLADAALLFLLKASADLLFLHLVTRFFAVQELMKIFPMAFILNLIMTPVIFIASRTMHFTWKGRSYKK